jgi:hypothetical protein
MTMLVMQDSIYPRNLTTAADAWLAYVNGKWPTYAEVVARFPGRHVLGMTVFPGANAEGCDCESGDLTPAQVPAFVKAQLARGVYRPVVYASASNIESVLADLSATGIARASIRLLSAHYGDGQHICGPASCKWSGVPACDGTQWTDAAPGAGGSKIDESWLLPGFFAPAPKPVAAGPVTITADGRQSLAQIAAAHGTQPSGILRATAIADGLYPANVAAWINAEFGKSIPPAGAVLHIP